MKPPTPFPFARLAALALAATGLGPIGAASSELANAPLFTSSAGDVKPNIMFIMDNSGSMDYTFLPQAAQGVAKTGRYGLTASQCNGLAYNPQTNYLIPLDHNGPKATPSLQAGNPEKDTTTQRNLTDTVAMPAVDATVTVKLKSGQNSVSYEVGSQVTIFQNATTYFTGEVTAWNSYNRELKLTVDSVFGSGSLTSPKVGKGTPNLPTYYVYKGSQARLNYTYDSSGNVKTDTTFYKECNSKVGENPGRDVFQLVTVTPTSAEALNYAIWSTYYRSRMQLMQAGVSHAFNTLDDRYRVGYITINKHTNSENFLDVNDFTFDKLLKTGHKKSFYDKLWAADAEGGTPLRGALAHTGQYFAKKLPSQTYDPVQYSCQRNFAILSTDGYWNQGSGVEDAPYGPYKLDRTTKVGQQDGDLPRPLHDGSSTTVSVKEKWKRTLVTDWTSIVVNRVTTGQEKKTTETTANKVRTRDYYERGSHSCGWGQTPVVKYLETSYRVSVKVTTARTGQTQYEETVTVPKKRTEVLEVTREVRTVDGIQILDEEKTRQISNTTEEGTATVTSTSPKALANSSTTSGPTSYAWQPGTLTAVNQSCELWMPGNSNWKESNYSNTTTTVTGPAPFRDTEKLSGPSNSSEIKQPPVDDKESMVTETSSSQSGGHSHTLADVAAYYYQTDLRTSELNNCAGAKGADVCENNVPGNASTDPYRSFGDSAAWQHLTTYTLGLGVDGLLDYDPNYQNLRTGHFHEIVNGTRNWPAPKEAGGSESWPANVDDLWHAAVNGRGQYFNARDPASLSRALTSTLEQIKAITGSASAASTSSLQPVNGDNDIFIAQFTTQEWVGDVLSYKVHPVTGEISTTPTWSAQAKLDGRTAERKILFAQSGALQDFTWANLQANHASKFSNFCSKLTANGTTPEQCGTLNATDLAAANGGANLVDFLRGKQTLTYYRARSSRLGDIVNSSPLYIGKPSFQYEENGYKAWANLQTNRTSIVLAAANDGMLHAFRRSDGEELWAFVPTPVLGNLFRLADTAYAGKHAYFVDGALEMGDVYLKNVDGGGSWRTIVVGGLGKGGRGYYALDVTDPVDPKLLWEFTHDNLGYTYGNPIITKAPDGTWVVAFASGYDNTTTGDGNGHLFVLNAATGKVVNTFSTYTDADGLMPAGSKNNYSGLAKINAWVDSELVNKATRFYGGDLLGNLWRFDMDKLEDKDPKAVLLAQLIVGGKPQPITTQPAVAAVPYNGREYPVVFLGTGAYLREGDPADQQVQSVYAIKDTLTDEGYGDLRANESFVVQTIVAGTDSNKRPTREQKDLESVNWAQDAGWRVDFPVGGERVSVSPQLAIDTLFVGTNLPKVDACTVGGDSFLYRFNFMTGKFTSSYVGNVLVQGLTVIQLSTGDGDTRGGGALETLVTRSDGRPQGFIDPVSTGVGTLRRTSWRELVD